ncbi:MAG: oxidoreductase [Methylothermaceae bacteria B42]|nr:MAG: oxidoreductase [Methylothermaceae bacteria B42]HHJ38190.1 SDR family NAD(P)-dependent oxidoreductase [Methylothermaceae bacterium]
MNTILITGCSSGIGYVTAKGLKERGYRVFASARKAEDVERLKQEGFEAVQLDLDDSESIQKAVNQVLEWTGGTLDALFNNGAWGQIGAVEDLSREVLKAQFETNFFGTHELTNLILPVMRKQGYGRILYNSSVLGFVALPFRGAYNASKFALEGLVDTLRLELYKTKIYPVLIEPGPILSKFRENAYHKFKQNIDAQHSPYRELYKKMEQRLATEGPVVPFTLPAEAVLQKVIYALESPRPKIRYYVTFPTYLFAFLRRILPFRLLDWVLRKV